MSSPPTAGTKHKQSVGNRAVVLLSGGLDSATILAIARSQGYQVYALSFSYGQKHCLELEAAQNLAESGGVAEHRILTLDPEGFRGSALTSSNIAVPERPGDGIPVTYVPARNTIFLSMALGWAEVLGARDIFIGVNAVDYSGYPDCRGQFIRAFEALANLATKAGVEGGQFSIRAPLLELSKAEIIRLGMKLGVEYASTLSCYQPDEKGLACGRCDSCRLRRAGFLEAQVPDPTHYQS